MFDWQAALSKTDLKPTDFAPTCQAAQTCAILLTQRALLRVSGPDAQKFLQGQCTSDIARLTAGEVLIGAHCTHKGRMNSSFFAALLGSETVGLQVHSSIAEHAYASLKKYIVFSKAEITPARDIGCLAIAGPQAKDFLAAAGLDAPQAGHFARDDSATVLGHAEDQYEVWTEEAKLLELISFAKSRCALTGENHAELLAIRRGIGEVRTETVEEFIPQDLNLQLTGGISFSKGCYTGQEIIARMHYKGKLKKHMYRGTTDTAENPAPGSPVLDASGKSVGKVVRAARNENQQTELLALVNDEALAGEAFVAEVNSESKISWLALPYAIP